MKKKISVVITLSIFSLLVMGSAFASPAPETLALQCKFNRSGMDTMWKSELQLYATPTTNQFGVKETSYRLVYSYEDRGMTGGKQFQFTKSWDGLGCSIDGTSGAQMTIECGSWSDKKAILVSMAGGRLNVLEEKQVTKYVGLDEIRMKLYSLQSEGKSLLFGKRVGDCERF